LTKEELRRRYAKERRQLTSEIFEEQNKLLRDQLFQELSGNKGLIHVFLPIQAKKEVDTWPVLYWCWERGYTTCTSITHFSSNQLTHSLINAATEFEENKWGVPEPIGASIVLPSEIDIVLIPMLCFDLNGHRVGYGKGYYDRFLSECRKDVTKIGLCLANPIEKIDDTSDQDITMDKCITPLQVHRF